MNGLQFSRAGGLGVVGGGAQTVYVDPAVISGTVDPAVPCDWAVEFWMDEGVLRAPVLAVPQHLQSFRSVGIQCEILCIIDEKPAGTQPHIAILVWNHRNDNAICTMICCQSDAPSRHTTRRPRGLRRRDFVRACLIG